MPENPIYDFLKANKLTDKDETTFLKEYADSAKAKELYSFFEANKLTDKSFDDFYGAYLKKKDWVSRIFDGGEKPTNGNGLSGGLLGKAVQPTEREQLTNYLLGLKTDEEKKLSQPKAITTGTIYKKPENLSMPIDEKSIVNAQKKLGDIMYGEGEGWKDPMGQIRKGIIASDNMDDVSGYGVAQILTEKSLMPDGFDAKRALSSSTFSGAGKDNLTAETLRNRVDEYEKTVAPFRDINPQELTYLTKDKLYDAAIRAYANNNTNFKKQLEAAGIDINKEDISLSIGDNNAKRGQIMSVVLQNPDLHTFLEKENPDLIPALKDIQENLIYDNKDYGKVQIANEISRDMQSGGYNKIDPIFNLENSAKKTGDVTAEALYANDPKKLQFYRENKDDILNKLDAPSLFTGFAEAGKGFGRSILNTFTQPFTSPSKTMKEGWEKEASHVSADPKGLVKFLSDSGHALGFVASIGATGNVFGAVGLSPNAASMTSLGVGFLGDNLEQAKMKYPDSPVKQWTSALFNTGLFMAMGKNLFPAAKVEQALIKVQPGISKVIDNLASGSITREAARAELNTWGKKAIDIASEGLQKNLKVSAEMTGITILNKTLDRLMGMDDQTFQQFHPEGEEADTFKSMFLSNIIVNSMAAYGQVKAKNNIAKESIYEAATNPNRYRNIIESSEISKNVTDTKDMLDNLDYITGIKKDLDARGLSEKQKKDYLLNALKSKVLNASKPSSPDATLTRQYSERIKDLEEINQGILEGKDADEVITTSEQKGIDEMQKKVDKGNDATAEIEMLTKNQELDNKEIDTKISQLEKKDNPLYGVQKERLEQQKKEYNDYYNSAIKKLSKPSLIAQAIKAVDKDLPEYLREGAKADIESMLREVAEQLNSSKSEAKTARSMYGETISDIALKLYPDAKTKVPEGYEEKLVEITNQDRKLEGGDVAKEEVLPSTESGKEVSGSALKDVGKSVIGSDVDLKGNKKEVWMSPFDVSVFNTGKKIVTLNFLNREFRIQSENGNIELDELTAKGKAKHFNQKVDLTPDELAEYNSIQKDISENGTTRENNKRSNDLTNKIIDRLNIGNEVEKLGQNKNQQVVEIKNALDAGEYQKAIADGKMTSADAKKIIESAGFEVPKEILEAQAPTQYTEASTPPKKETSGVSGSALKDENKQNQRNPIIDSITDLDGSINKHFLREAVIKAPVLLSVNEKSIGESIGYLRKIANEVNDTELTDTVQYLEDAAKMVFAIKDLEGEKRNEFLSNSENFWGTKKPALERLKRLEDWSNVLKANTEKNKAERLLRDQYQQTLAEIKKRFVDEGQKPNRPKQIGEQSLPPQEVKAEQPTVSETKLEVNEKPTIQEADTAAKQIEQPTSKESEAGKVSIEDNEGAAGGKPPTGEGKVEAEMQQPGTELSFKGLQEVANEFGYEDVKSRDRVTDLEELENAKTTAEQWASEGKYQRNIDNLLFKIENKELVPTAKQRLILQQYLANESEKLRGITDKTSKEYTDQFEKVKYIKKVGQIARQEAGAALRIAEGRQSHPINDLVDATIVMEEANGNIPLSEKQKQEVDLMVKQYEERAKVAEQKTVEMEKKFAELQALKGIEKAKKSRQEYKSERDKIRQSIKDKWKSAGQDILSSDIPFRKQLAAISPDVVKLVKSYVQEGVTEFSEVVKKVHDFIKDFNPNIKEEDVVDMIAGKYDEVKETQADLIKKLNSIRDKKSAEAIKIRARIKAGDFAKKEPSVSWVNNPEIKKQFPKEYNEALDAITKREEAKLDFDIAVYKAQRAQRTKAKKGIDFIRALIATTKAVKSGIDDSAVMMQNIVAMIAHPRSAVKALKEHALDALSEKRFRRYLTELHNSPIWPLIEKSGLDITDPKSLKEQNKEEIFDNNLLNKDFKIGGKKFNVGKYVTRPFERAFTSLGNAMRVNMFTNISQRMYAEGKTFETHPEEFKSLARVLNTETGRGKLHTQIERASQLITAGIWSPRLMASRLNMLGLSELLPVVGGKPGYYSGLPPEIRKMAIADITKFLGAGVGLMLFAGSRGADVDDDPESPTFGTIKIGDKKYNAWGGFTPYAKTIFQGATGKRKINGQRVDITKGKLIANFFRSRLTPAASVTTNLLVGKDYSNKPVTVEGELINLTAPLSVSAIIDGLKKDGIIGILNQGIPSFVGIGVSDERDFQKKQNKPERPKIERPKPQKIARE